MWVMVLFDLPTGTKKEQKVAAKFRKDLLGDGFTMFQFSIYLRHCPSFENAQVHIARVKANLPELERLALYQLLINNLGTWRFILARNKQKGRR